jgi:hypothetical protein
VKPRPAVAVIAIHGVADQLPDSSAEAIASLLLQEGDPRRYTATREVRLQIPTRPAVRSTPDGGAQSSTFFDDERAQTAAALEVPTPTEAPDHQLMLSQLRQYEGSGRPYRTVRLETQRLNADGRPCVDVHVYEMYWADLSRLGTGVLRFFGELYQLLFHSASLGHQTLDYAALEHPQSGRWAALSGVHAWAVRILTIVIPSIALVIFGVGSIPMALLPAPKWRTAIAIGLLGAVLGLLLANRQYRRGAPTSFARWTLTRLVVIVAVALALRWALGRSDASLAVLLMVEWTVVAGLALRLVFRAFDRYRPGALKIGGRLYGVAVLAFLIVFLVLSRGRPEPGPDPVVVRTTKAVLWIVEALWAAGLLAWVAVLILGAIGWALGWRAVRHARKAARAAPGDDELAAVADRAARAVRTARLTLALPAAAFIIVTTGLWYAVVNATVAMFERSSLAAILQLPHCRLPLPWPSCSTVGAFLKDLLWGITTLGLPLAGGLLALGFGLLLWWVVPVALTEVRPPRGAAEQDLSEGMGLWLSRGFAYVLAWVTGLVALVVFVGAATAFASWWMEGSTRTLPEGIIGSAGALVLAGGKLARGAIEFLGGFLAAGAVGVLALRRGRLEAVSRAVRPVLDVVLDVDGYLREYPRERTPRARITERYVSLLRYLCAWRNPQEPHAPYQAIIIVAHSQGTVISADLLGFLHREHDPALDPIVQPPGAGGGPTIPTYLFTMGSPLRQLYEQFFPHLYSWVTRRPEAWQQVDLVPETALTTLGPDPSALRLSRWVNAYRSGDYIGRYLWLHDDDPARFQPGVRRPPNCQPRCDFCVGAGAHTHYWDSAEIARELDAQILASCAPGAP